MENKQKNDVNVKQEICSFCPPSIAHHDVVLHGYFASDPSTSAYRGIIGLSIANFEFSEDVIFLPRSIKATIIHILSALIKITLFVLAIFYLPEMHLYWKVMIAFPLSIIGSLVLNVVLQVKPRNFYLFNLSSVLDYVLILMVPILIEIFLPDLFSFAATFSIVFLLFVNALTKKLKGYSLYKYPEELFSMYKIGFKHGSHPNIDNYLGMIVKPLRWVY